MPVGSVGQKNPLEKGMATHSSIITWRIPWTEEPGGLQSVQIRTQLKQLSIAVFSIKGSKHLILCHPLLLPPSIFPSDRVFSNESVLHIR